MKRGRRNIALFAALAIAALSSVNAARFNPDIRVGSKKFTESVILAEIVVDLGTIAGATVVHRQELGGSRLLWSALLAGEIDLYPEYTGTLMREILANEHIADEAGLAAALAKRGLRVSRSLGFRDTYALGMMRQTAERLRITKISDLARNGSLRFGMSDEFLNRTDGWPALRRAYRLDVPDVRGLDHDIAYKALANGSIDVIDLYTTDAEIGHYGIRVIEDDRHHFPENDAVLLYRIALEQSAPKALFAVLELQGRISDLAMIAMNGAVKFDQRTEADVAAQFVAADFGVAKS